MGLFKFLGSGAGRVVRAVAGLVVIGAGIWLAAGVWQWVLIIVGLVPLLAGIFDFCVFAPLFGLPFVGSRLREHFSSNTDA